jgi:hypothetical protein
MALNDVHWADGAAMDFDRVAEMLRVDGYALIRGMFEPEEIQRLRDIVGAHLEEGGARYSLGKTQPNAAAHVPALGFVFTHPHVVALFRGIFGPRTTMFTRHCDIHKNMVSGWHKDSGETVKGGYFKGDYFTADDCQVYKIAVYLQDATPLSGLTIEPRSHRTARIRGGDTLQLPTRVGDAVIFDVRLSHSGQLPDKVERFLKLLSRIWNKGGRGGQDPKLVTWLHDIYWRFLGRVDRMSTFFTFGRTNDFTYDFAAANLDRQALQLSETARGGINNVRDIAATLERQGVLTYGIAVGKEEHALEIAR